MFNDWKWFYFLFYGWFVNRKSRFPYFRSPNTLIGICFAIRWIYNIWCIACEISSNFILSLLLLLFLLLLLLQNIQKMIHGQKIFYTSHILSYNHCNQDHGLFLLMIFRFLYLGNLLYAQNIEPLGNILDKLGLSVMIDRCYLGSNISSTTRHLKFSYVSILANLVRTDNETKSVKTIYK